LFSLLLFNKKLLEIIKADFAEKNVRNIFEILSLVREFPRFEAVYIYRLSSFFYQKGKKKAAYRLYRKNFRRNSIEIKPNVMIGPGFVIGHPSGIVIGAGTNIGRNFYIYQGVTLGRAHDKDGYPQIGDNVKMFAGSKAFGNIRIGSNVIIGVNSVVTKSTDDNCIIVGIPGKVLKYTE